MSEDEDRYSDSERAFGAEVLRLREERGWTLAEMAARLYREGILYASAMTVSRTEKAQRPVRMTEAIAYGRVFDRTVYELSEPDGWADFLYRGLASVQRYREHVAERQRLDDVIAEDVDEMRHWKTMIEARYTEEYVGSLSYFGAARWGEALTQLEVEIPADDESEAAHGEHSTEA